MKNVHLYFCLVLCFYNCKSVKLPEIKPSFFYVGTYTDGNSKGIYRYQLDAKGKLTQIGLVAKTQNPSFLAKTKDNSTLLAVQETNENGTGFVKSFAIEGDSLRLVSTSKSGGAHPCFVSVTEKGQVLVANYTGGNVGYLRLDNQQGLTNLLAVQHHFGKGTTPRQEAPHAHAVRFHPVKNEIIAADLGTNALWFSKLDLVSNTLAFTNQQTLQMPKGAGPRHFAFHPNTKWMYVLNELNNTVVLVKENNNQYFTEGSISLLPKGYTQYSKGADIHISKDGQFVYASNRGHNSIAIYRVNPSNGQLTLLGFESTKGENPRNFALSSNDAYLLVANQDTNNIVSFKRNSQTGLLTFVSEIAAPKPVCILF